MKIVDYIAKNTKKEVLNKTIEENLKVCVIIDDVIPYHFYKAIYTSLLKSQHSVGFYVQYLKSNLVVCFSSGVSVMLGWNSGVDAKMKNDIPQVIIWHCLSRRHQLDSI